jgi:TonB-dependent SusC/RagA subfamily outer membrane receptor
MRPIVLALLLPLAAGCDGNPVTGPEAQRVVAQAKEARGSLFLTGALVFVDGVRLASDKSVRELDPTTVETVEVLKGAAASRLYGPEGARGVILITTKRAAAVPAPSR